MQARASAAALLEPVGPACGAGRVGRGSQDPALPKTATRSSRRRERPQPWPRPRLAAAQVRQSAGLLLKNNLRSQYASLAEQFRAFIKASGQPAWASLPVAAGGPS